MAGDSMNDDARMREHLSALADGELQGEAFAQAVAYAATEEGESAWRIYHLIGDTLRSSEVTYVADPAFLGRLREQLALEPRHAGVATAQPLVQVAPAPREAAPHAQDAAATASAAGVPPPGRQFVLGQRLAADRLARPTGPPLQ